MKREKSPVNNACEREREKAEIQSDCTEFNLGSEESFYIIIVSAVSWVDVSST